MNFVKTFCFLSIIFLFLSTGVISASTTNGTIDLTGVGYKYAWAENAGWINFGCINCNVHITDSGLTGYAWSQNNGWINLNPSQSGVKINSSGNLSGQAWGEYVGWIDFSGVSIDSNGQFYGTTASNDIIGKINFNFSTDCSGCKVVTDYRPSSARGGGGGGGSYIPNTETVTTNNTTEVIEPVVVAPTTITAIDQLKAKIAELQQQIASILSQTTPVITQPVITHIFTKNLYLGDIDPEVKYLQQYLNTHNFPVATSGVGSLGKETNKFGALTKQALIKFQEANADSILKPWFTKGTGIFGPMTRNFINGK